MPSLPSLPIWSSCRATVQAHRGSGRRRIIRTAGVASRQVWPGRMVPAEQRIHFKWTPVEVMLKWLLGTRPWGIIPVHGLSRALSWHSTHPSRGGYDGSRILDLARKSQIQSTLGLGPQSGPVVSLTPTPTTPYGAGAYNCSPFFLKPLTTLWPAGLTIHSANAFAVLGFGALDEQVGRVEQRVVGVVGRGLVNGGLASGRVQCD
jgi:hypothetical protein